MEVCYNKHYVAVDDRGRITDGWSNGPLYDKNISEAICINERGSYQFRLVPGGEENPPLFTVDNIPLYKLVDNQVVPRPEDEIDADRAAIFAPGPTAAEQLEAQITYTAMMTNTLLGQTQVVYTSIRTTDTILNLDKIKRWYKFELWTAEMVKEAVLKKVLTKKEASQILGEEA